jgi:peptidoglycan/xylan/chitin deacetylase (PgdA/CDA1 family)
MKRVVALEFHDVVPDPAAGAEAPVARLQLRARELERLLAELRQLGCQTISSRAFRAWQRGQGHLPERAVVLTFDDGHASHFDLVVPLLMRYRFTGTFFITVDRVGRPGWMTWDQLRKLVFLGMEVGSRGMSRESLAGLSRVELAKELARSKDMLEERLGVPVRALAAPSGDWNAGVASAARHAGFDALWISAPGTNGPETQALALRRLTMRRPFSLQQVLALVDGWQPAFWWAARQQVAIRGLKRILGVYWYEQLKRRLVPNA